MSCCRLDVGPGGGTGSFLPTVATPHELRVFLNGALVECCPMFVEVFPDISRILYSGIAPCALGSLVEVLVCTPKETFNYFVAHNGYKISYLRGQYRHGT